MSVELLGGKERKLRGVLEIEKMGVEMFCHCKWSKINTFSVVVC